jgi:hypothetical protein
MKGLELENQRLRKAVSDLTLDKLDQPPLSGPVGMLVHGASVG